MKGIRDIPETTALAFSMIAGEGVRVGLSGLVRIAGSAPEVIVAALGHLFGNVAAGARLYIACAEMTPVARNVR